MKPLLLPMILWLTLECRIPSFNRKFRYRFSAIGKGSEDGVCVIDAASIGRQLSCVNCVSNITNVFLSKQRNRAYLAARSMLVTIDLKECKGLKNIPWIGESQPDCGDECANYLSHIIDMGHENLIVCGTNFGSPNALRLQDMSIMEQFEQSNLCAKSVSPEISYLKSRDILFAGINEDRTHSTITKFVISGSGEISSEKAVTTEKYWLEKVEFLTSFTKGDFVYFVMREISEDKRLNAVVGRACINDPGFVSTGSQAKIGKYFRTFTKTRISCKIPVSGSETLGLPVATTAAYNSNSNRIYVAFTKYLHIDMGGYVICSYNLDHIDDSFNGEYLTVDTQGRTVTVNAKSDMDCKNHRPKDDVFDRILTNSIIKQENVYPIYYELKKFTSLISDTVNGYTILYVGTDSGTVEKLVLTKNNGVTLSTEFQLAESHVQIKSLQFTSNYEGTHLVAASEESVIKFPVHECHAHKELDKCIGIRDPYCCWCKTSHSCSYVNNCSSCVNDPESGKVLEAFDPYDKYILQKKSECIPNCDRETFQCTTGTQTVKYYKLRPSLSLQRESQQNCTYSGIWDPYISESKNVSSTVEDGDERAMFGVESSQLYKILAIAFGCLFLICLGIIAFLFISKTRAVARAKRYQPKQKINIDRSNSSNIIHDKPGFMTNRQPPVPMVEPTHLRIMPQKLKHLDSNSPYHSQMTPEDEGLLQLPSSDYNQAFNHYASNIGAQTLPRNFGNNRSLEPTHPQHALTMIREPRNLHQNYPPNMLP